MLISLSGLHFFSSYSQQKIITPYEINSGHDSAAVKLEANSWRLLRTDSLFTCCV